jgi:hypothetical protein
MTACPEIHATKIEKNKIQKSKFKHMCYDSQWMPFIIKFILLFSRWEQFVRQIGFVIRALVIKPNKAIHSMKNHDSWNILVQSIINTHKNYEIIDISLTQYSVEPI